MRESVWLVWEPAIVSLCWLVLDGLTLAVRVVGPMGGEMQLGFVDLHVLENRRNRRGS